MYRMTAETNITPSYDNSFFRFRKICLHQSVKVRGEAKEAERELSGHKGFSAFSFVLEGENQTMVDIGLDRAFFWEFMGTGEGAFNISLVEKYTTHGRSSSVRTQESLERREFYVWVTRSGDDW